MGMANGKTMAFALLAENRYGYQENHTDKLATKSRTPTAAQRWTVAMMTDFYFAIGKNPKDVFVVVGEKWILYKHCETAEIAKVIVDGQNKSRGRT